MKKSPNARIDRNRNVPRTPSPESRCGRAGACASPPSEPTVVEPWGVVMTVAEPLGNQQGEGGRLEKQDDNSATRLARVPHDSESLSAVSSVVVLDEPPHPVHSMPRHPLRAE